MKKTAQKPLILSAYPRGEHLDLFTVMEERKEVRTQVWERMASPVTSNRKAMSGQIGTDTGKFPTTILCVDSSNCLLQALSFPTSIPKELDSMVAASVSLFPVLTQPEYINSYAVLEQDVRNASVLSVTFRKDELIPLLEKVEQWGADFPLVVPDAWVVWRELTINMQMPEEYVWVWIDPTVDDKKISLKVFVVSRGQPRFVFQPFVAMDREENLAGTVAGVLRLAMECAAREQKGVADDTAFYFTSYRLKLGNLAPRLGLGRHPVGQLAPEHPPQECAANLCQRSASSFKNWLPNFWKTYQTQRSLVRRRFKLLKVASIVYVVLLAGLLGLSVWQKRALANEAADMELQRPEYEKALGLKKQVQRMRTQAEGDQNALDVLYLTTMALPKGVTLTGYGFKFQDGLSLRGFASNNASVYDFVEALKKQKPFRSVELNSVRNNPLKNWVEFDIQCKLGSPAESSGAPGNMAALEMDGAKSR